MSGSAPAVVKGAAIGTLLAHPAIAPLFQMRPSFKGGARRCRLYWTPRRFTLPVSRHIILQAGRVA